MAKVQLFQNVGCSGSPVRFAVEIEEKQYRLFSYFPVGDDSSFSLHSYFPGTHTYRRYIDKSPQSLEPSEAVLRLSECAKKAEPFVPHKRTFHKSGTMNIKNKAGDRMKGDFDVKSLPFESIPGFLLLCIIFPTSYNRYPLIREEDNKRHNILRLEGNAKKMPLMIEIHIKKDDYDLEDKLKSTYEDFVSFVDRNTLAKWQLEIYTVFRKSAQPHFPTTEVEFRYTY